MIRQCRTIRRASGITLVEVLATLVLVAVVLPVAMRGVTLSLHAAARARHQTEAAQLAANKINEHLVLRDSAQLAGQGYFGPAWPEYRWESRATTADHGLQQLTVDVFWLERGQERSVSLTTLVYPTAMGTGSL